MYILIGHKLDNIRVENTKTQTLVKIYILVPAWKLEVGTHKITAKPTINSV